MKTSDGTLKFSQLVLKKYGNGFRKCVETLVLLHEKKLKTTFRCRRMTHELFSASRGNCSKNVQQLLSVQS